MMGCKKPLEKRAELCPHVGTVALSGSRLGAVGVMCLCHIRTRRGPSCPGSSSHYIEVSSQPQIWYRTSETHSVSLSDSCLWKNKGHLERINMRLRTGFNFKLPVGEKRPSLQGP